MPAEYYVKRTCVWIQQCLAIAIWGGAVAFASASYGANQKNYVVAASKVRWQVNLDQVKCVSLLPNGATIFQKDFFDDPGVTDILNAIWPEKIIYRDNPNCPYVIDFSILSGITRAVKYSGRPSVVSMAFQICARKPDAGIDDKNCSYKNIYLFQSEFTHLEAFEIGAKAFAQPQESDSAVLGLHLDKPRR